MSANNNIPEELIEEILLKLPIKSLFRFSTVSKSWNLMIFRQKFMKRYRGREMVVLRAYSDGDDGKALAIPLSSILSANPDPIHLCPFTNYASASCGEMWCLEFENSLVLYNPSIQRYRKLPTPSATVPIGSTVEQAHNTVFVYGLGYDSEADDYKIVKIHRHSFVMAELYSLKNDCWREINSPPSKTYQFSFYSTKGVFVNGAVHWLVTVRHIHTEVRYGPHILYFHLSREKYGVLKLLPQLPELLKNEELSRCLDMIAFGGKLRVCVNYGCHTRFAVWVMEDYESNLWIKEVEINYAHVYPLCYANLRPFYFYDGGGNVIKAVTSSTDMQKIFIYKEENDGSSTLVEKNVGNIGCAMFDTYVESFISVYPGGN